MANTIICIKDLIPRHTTPDPRYQNPTDPTGLRNHDLLSRLLLGAAYRESPAPNLQCDFIVRAVHHVMLDDGERPVTFDSHGPPVAQENDGAVPYAGQEVPAAADAGAPDETPERNAGAPDETPEPNDGAVDETAAAVDGQSNSCMDLKNFAKLTKLCYSLDENVKKLKEFYDNKGYSFSKTDQAAVETGLRSLADDMPRLLRALNHIGGHRREIQKVADVYSSYESRYRELRSVCSTNVKSRRKTDKTPRNGDDDSGLCTTIKEYACKILIECCVWKQTV